MTWDDALLYCCLGRIQSVCHTVFLLPYFYLAAAPHLEDGHTAAQLGQALLQLFSASSTAPVRPLLDDMVAVDEWAHWTLLTCEEHT